MNKVSLFLFSMCFSGAPCWAAANAKPAASSQSFSLRQEALKENQSLDKKAYKKTIQASEAQQANVSSFLKLQDPTPELRNRPWLWTFTFKMQSLKPSGTGQVTGFDFALQNYGASLMPAFGFGFMLPPLHLKHLDWSTGLSAQAGYMSQKTNLVTPNGFNYDNTRLTTTLASVAWMHRVKFPKLPQLHFSLSPEMGFVNYTQTNVTSSTANFTQQNHFWGVGLGMEYAWTPKWGLLAQYTYREARPEKAQTSNVQKNNLEIGTQVTW